MPHDSESDSTPDIVHVFDTTLRDGEQSPGVALTRPEKVDVALALEALGVDVIEAGFPVASDGELAAVRDVAQAVARPEVAALCRTRAADIQAAWDAVGSAASPRLHVFIATSDIHLRHKLKMSRAEVLREIERGVGACASLSASVEFSAEDATRTDVGFLREVTACAVEHGATVVNLPDTVGYTMPWEYEAMVREMVAVIAATGRDAIISTHCHDDLGLAVANSLAAVAAGARQVECCVNGIGERAGNAALEEVVMALRTRSALLGCDTRVDPAGLVSLSRLVSGVTGIAVPPNKAVVGDNAFAHESGIHQHGVLAERATYEIMSPEAVGFACSTPVLGKHSGCHALESRLTMLGHRLQRPELDAVFRAFKALCDVQKGVSDDDLHQLVAVASPSGYPAPLLEATG